MYRNILICAKKQWLENVLVISYIHVFIYSHVHLLLLTLHLTPLYKIILSFTNEAKKLIHCAQKCTVYFVVLMIIICLQSETWDKS